MLKVELSSRDHKDIDRFTKYLIYKFVQTVVQSRQGSRIVTRSKQFSSSDWFNVSIHDLPDILDSVKNVFGSRPINLAQPLCVETSLRTSEDETMTLEYWCLHLTDKVSVPDTGFQVAMGVYNNITILLKSLITVTRLTPAYQLSRQQSADTYTIRYDIRFHEPASYNAADDCFCQQQIGVVPSPLGAIVAYVVYRTKLSICPRQLTPDLTSTIKDDHFNTMPCWNRQAKHGLDATRQDFSPGSSPVSGVVLPSNDLASTEEVWLRQKKPAFGPSASDTVRNKNFVAELDLPFASLLQHASARPANINNENMCHRDHEDLCRDSNNSDTCGQHLKVDNSVSSESRSSALSTVRDDFVMVELKAPFAGQEDELGRFYRDCQMAPSLSMFEQACSLQEMLSSITDQLAQFEASADEFNEFVSSLQELE